MLAVMLSWPGRYWYEMPVARSSTSAEITPARPLSDATSEGENTVGGDCSTTQ